MTSYRLNFYFINSVLTIAATVYQILVHYKGYHQKFDTWIDKSSDRIRPFGRNRMVNKRREVKQWKIPTNDNSNLSNSDVHYNLDRSSDDKENRISSGKYDYKYSECKVTDERTRKISDISDQYLRYKRALEQQNLRVFPVLGDGNCLFRAVAHQVYGDDRLHYLVRSKCVDYMEQESDFFSQFIEGGKESFPLYLQAKRMDACWGDDPEITVSLHVVIAFL